MILARLGRVLYWAAIVLIGLAIVSFANVARPLDTFDWIVIGIGLALVWGFGRAAQYVLAGE
jgi:hypothetical protein